MSSIYSVQLTPQGFGTLAICAIRYCQGRQTYMPATVRGIWFKRCRSCFRCEEKGSRRRHFLDDISVKSGKDAVVHCCSACSPDIHGDQYHAACEWYEPRWYWNLKQRLFNMAVLFREVVVRDCSNEVRSIAEAGSDGMGRWP